jgi:GMP synthase-like glutamine amidotransferase
MRWCLLVCGPCPPWRSCSWQHYEETFQNDEKTDTFEPFEVYKQRFPSFSYLDTFDVIVLTGSRFDAHAREPWMLRVESLAVAAIARGKKVIGVCFGHQLMANALLGRSGRAKDWELGVRALDLQPSFRELLSSIDVLDRNESLRIGQSHQDQVLVLPAGAEILASSSKCPVEIYRLENSLLCFQGHPEWSIEYICQALEKGSGRWPPHILEEAHSSIRAHGRPQTAGFRKLIRLWASTPLFPAKLLPFSRISGMNVKSLSANPIRAKL